MLTIRVLEKNLEVEEGTSFETIAKQFQSYFKSPILLAKQNNKLIELSHKIQQGGEVIFYDITCMEGMRVYHRSVSFLMIKAVKEMLGKKASVVIEHSLHKSLYCEVREKDVEVNQKFLDTLTEKMKNLVERDIPINKYAFHRDDAIEKVREFGMENKARLFRFRRSSNINLYEMDGVYDYFYGYMVPSTGYLKSFQLMLYENGFLIRFPDRKNPNEILKFTDPEKVSSVFMEQMKWCSLMKVNNVADLNEAITDGKFGDLVRINEALHEKKVAEIADKIYKKRDKVKVVLIAGPSSSGKTSFSHRLSVQLQTFGIRPKLISLDNYFKDRKDTPKDENGKYDFECLGAIDIELFNKDMVTMLNGGTAELPEFNFLKGEREYKGNFMKLGHDDIFVIEGIHGLNDALSHSLPKESKFKIYISALAQLNIDEHNRISTTDGRLIRRMVRDARTRGTDAAHTIAMWPSVRRGEDRYIFPFQEEADVMFNSSLIYELAVLKPYAEGLLFGIQKDVPEYIEAKRFLKFLDYFIGINSQDIPKNSLLREFVGGSIFNV